MGWWYLFIGIVIGAVAAYFIVRWAMKRELTANPPINEAQIRAMYEQMGRKPSQKQVNQVMASMKAAGQKANKQKKKKK